MIRWISMLLAFICVLSACEEGGSRGSGVTTAIEGNVASVDTATALAHLRIEGRTDTASSLADITVAVDGTRIRYRTDAEGRFVLRGAFDGPVRLTFRRLADALLARIAVKVPAGGTLTLHDVHIDAAQEVASAETQEVECQGLITSVRCSEALMTMVSVWDRADDPGEYTVRLDTSMLRDASGNVLTCSDLRNGLHALVQALVEDDGSFGNGLIRIDD